MKVIKIEQTIEIEDGITGQKFKFISGDKELTEDEKEQLYEDTGICIDDIL